MKTKLLKKVRKQYSIIRVDNIGSHPRGWLSDCVRMYGLPFFYVINKNPDWLDQYRADWGYKTLQEAKDYILEKVLAKYSKKFRFKPEITKKVWYLQ